ncbi:MAG TPA: hypothetical protein VLI06_17120, partial [Solimonas sp.]|nr:hypothetical protein [Solimonas sp.]
MQSPGSALSAAALGSWRQNLAALLDAHEHAGGSLFGAPGAPPLLLPPPQQPVLSLQESASLSLPAACRYDSVSQPWTLSVDGAPCLLDHLVDGRPVLPMALALETMAQFAAQQAPQWVVVEVRELAVLSGIALDARHRPRPLLLRGRPVPTAEGTLCWAVEIADARRGNTCYRAQVLLQAQLPSPPAAMDWAASRGEALTAQHIYGEILFHGPWF